MSAARPVFKRVKLMLTRSVRGRAFLLRPSKRTNRIVGYVVAVMQAKWNIRIHAMSNHWHVVLTDPDGNVVRAPDRRSSARPTEGLCRVASPALQSCPLPRTVAVRYSDR